MTVPIVPPSRRRPWGGRDSLAVALLLAALLATALLGRWQQHRAQAKRALLAAIATRAALPPLPQLPATLDGLAWRRADASGVWRADWSVALRNRSHGSASGFLVLTPLRLDADRHYLMVERGWVAPSADGVLRLPAPAPGRVELTGRLAPAPSSWLALGHESEVATIRQNIDLGRWAAAHQVELLPYVLQQTAPAEPGLLSDWPQPDLGIATNVGYAFQWWAMSVLSALLLLAYVWRRLRRKDDHDER